MARTPTKTTPKKLITKAGAKTAAKAVGKKIIPGMAVYGAARAIKERRYADAVGEAAWLTIPTGVLYETAKMLPKETPKEAKARRSRNWKI